MTVKELIQELQQYDPDLTVKIWTREISEAVDNVCLVMNSDETPDYVEISS